jgi:arylsulfatase A-like enzyme
MNFVLVVADSLRADRLSCAGFTRPTSPFLDALAARGVLFERAYTPVSPTRPAVATLLSGQHPLTHGIVGKRFPRRPSRRMVSLPETLARAGWDTLVIDSLAGRGGSPWLRRGFGAQVALGADGSRPDAAEFNAVARGWIRRRRRPFFAFVRYCDTHTPYRPPKEYRRLFYEGDPTRRNAGSLRHFWERPHRDYFVDEWERPLREEWPEARGERIEDVEFFRAMYDSCVRALDDGIAELFDAVERAGVLDETLFVVTADHGESLGEHDVYFGHVGLHETVLRVPCIVAGAGVAAGGRRVRETVETPDLAPTLLELAQVGAGGELDGRALAPGLRGRAPAARTANARLACEATYRAGWALTNATHKVIAPRSPGLRVELYDLRADPWETRDLAEREPALREALLAQLEERLAAELAARGLRRDPVAAALSHVHAPLEGRSAFWRVARRAIRKALRQASALVRPADAARAQACVRRKGSRRPAATAQTT